MIVTRGLGGSLVTQGYGGWFKRRIKPIVSWIVMRVRLLKPILNIRLRK